MTRLKTVLHVHTNYSHDSNQSPAEVVAAALREQVSCVAITDHDEIRGAREARALAPQALRVIVGQEISTADGHLIGLFLEEPVPPGRPAAWTAEQIHLQGGIVLAPHPFATLCDARLGDAVHELVSFLDAVETCNAQNPLTWQDARAARFARKHGLVPYMGADAHIRGRLAACYQMLADFSCPRSFLEALRRAELYPGRFGLGYFLQMGVRHVWDALFRNRIRGFGVNANGEPAPRKSKKCGGTDKPAAA